MRSGDDDDVCASSLSTVVQKSVDLEKLRCQRIYYDIFERVRAKLMQDISILEKKGVRETVLRIPCISEHITRPPPQSEVDLFVHRQLMRRGFHVSETAHPRCVNVDWSHIADKKDERRHNKKRRECVSKTSSKNDTSPSEMLPPPKTLPSLPALPSLAPPKRNPSSTNASTNARSSLPLPDKKKATLQRAETTTLPPHVERKIAKAHQNVLRALAGV